MSKVKTADFDYHLPPELIAQKPFFPRDQCRLMVLDKKRGQIQHRRFFEIVDYLRQGDVLVLNNSKVFKARLFGRLSLRAERSNPIQLEKGIATPFGLAMTDKEVEIFLLRSIKNKVWQVLANPGRKLKPGAMVYFSEKIWCEVINKVEDKYLVKFNISNRDLMKWVDKHGHVPVPPYIKQEPKNADEYQTIYAQNIGSVAAPTAGFHFTKKLLTKLKRQGIKVCYLTLHVGYGTFKPIKSEYITEHKIEPEWVEIPKAVAEEVNRAKQEGRRVVAVGTTTVRALEGVCKFKIQNAKGKISIQNSKLLPYNDEVNLFITPGFKFKIVDALITNFHLPKSTLLLLVSALGGQENIHRAYQEAIKKKYRFYSFGDAMFIV